MVSRDEGAESRSMAARRILLRAAFGVPIGPPSPGAPLAAPGRGTGRAEASEA